MAMIFDFTQLAELQIDINDFVTRNVRFLSDNGDLNDVTKDIIWSQLRNCLSPQAPRLVIRIIREMFDKACVVHVQNNS